MDDRYLITSGTSLKPQLRQVDVRPVVLNGQSFFMLRDPLGIASREVFVPAQLAPALALMDGKRDARDIWSALSLKYNVGVSLREIEEFIKVLDSELYLEGDKAREREKRILQEYLNLPARSLTGAGLSYPADSNELEKFLQQLIENACKGFEAPQISSTLRGVITPHIDYIRGWRVYGRVWASASLNMNKKIDRVIILGTDHFGGKEPLTFTRKSFETPWGVARVDEAVVNYLAEPLGDSAFSGELRHKGEHSIELALNWLTYIRDKTPPVIVPILCGSIHQIVWQSSHPMRDGIEEFLRRLRELALRDDTLLVSAADLSHVGPAFGGEPLDLQLGARLRESDAKIKEFIVECNAGGFLSHIMVSNNPMNVCSVGSIYLLLQALSPGRGIVVDYERCPADERGTSAVTITGALIV